MSDLIKKTIQIVAAVLALVVFGAIALATDSHAQTVSLTFDDGFLSTYEKARPILSSKNLKATVYVTPGYINSGYAEPGIPAMTWQQVISLQNDYGWEIGGHSYTHAELPNLTNEQIINELVRSTDELKSYGLAITNFASPYGAYDNRVLTEALKLYDSHRGYWDRDALNAYPYNKDVLMVKAVESSTRVSTVKSWIDNAISNKKWLILVFHDVQPKLNPQYGYVTKTSDLTNIVNYLSQKNVSVKTVAEALKKPGVKMLPNADFSSGLSGWNTDTSSQVLIDTGNNGAFPNPVNSVKMTGGLNDAHLFSEKAKVSSSGSYFMEAFFNTTNLTSGEFGFYVDEYDQAGNWISGKWLGSVANSSIGYFSRVYTRSSDSVDKVSLQLYLTRGSDGYVFVDNIDFHDNNGSVVSEPTPTPTTVPTATPSATPAPSATPTATPTATVTPTVTPSATPTATPTAMPTATPVVSLVSNASFEDTDSSNWVLNWVRQTVNWVVDSVFAESGSKSVKVTGTSRTHLFSDLISVESGKSYTWKQYVKADKVGSEFGFYIDEYDASGNWISGQWKGGIWSPFSGVKTFIYNPTSNNVAKIGLQYYLAGGSSDSLIYLDSVSLTSN